MAMPATIERRARRRHTALVDCDVHNAVPSDGALLPYLPARWQTHLERIGPRTYSPYVNGFAYPKVSAGGGARLDAWPPSGALPGSDLDFMRTQLLDPFGIDVAILNCLYRAAEQRNELYGAALARAVNDWQVEQWLEPEPRLRASITVTYESPDLAAAEIDRAAAAHPGFVQVLLFPRTREPLGKRRYWPIFEAAERHKLPIGVHFASTTAAPITAGGWPSYYIEDHTAMSMAFQAQLTSLVFEGVFDRFPSLRIALVEGGFAWLPPLMWRLDGLYRQMGDEVPHLTRPPSEYIREHVRLTTQPVEEPENPRDIVGLIQDVGPEMLMFSTDYPHWDFDNPERAFQVPLPGEIRDQIMRTNAESFYNLEAGRHG